MKVVSEKENKLLKRKELLVHFEGQTSTLSRVQVRAELVKKLKASENLLVISHFGSRDFDVRVYVYESEEALKKATSEHIMNRNFPKAEGEGEEED